MKNHLQFNKYVPTRQTLLTSILPMSVGLIMAAVALVNCSSGNSVSSSATPVGVPISLNYQPKGVNLENSGDGLGLVDTGTSPIITITSCASGYTSGNHTVLSGTVSLYNGDQNCLVILHSFIFQGNTYNDTNDGAVVFKLSGSASDATGASATFSDVASAHTAANLITVFIGEQVDAIVSGTSAIVFNFTDISAGATDNVSQTTVATAVPLTVGGRPAPNYYNAPQSALPTAETNGGIVNSRYLSTSSAGIGSMSFTVACGTTVTSNGTGDLNCPQPPLNYLGDRDTIQTVDVQHTEIQYILVPDATYGACATSGAQVANLSVTNANAIFASGTTLGSGPKTIPTTVSTGPTGTTPGQIVAGATDSWGNTVTNGGFDTASILTGISPIYSNTGSFTYANAQSNLNDLFILERLDVNGNVLSYLYSCVDLAAITQD